MKADTFQRCDFLRDGKGWLCVGRDALGNPGGIMAPGATRQLAYDQYLSQFLVEAEDHDMERQEEREMDRLNYDY